MPPLAPAPAPRTRSALRVTVGAVLGLAGLYGLALALLSRPEVEARLHARLEQALRERVGEVELGPEVRVDPLLRVTFGPVVVPGEHRRDPPVVRIEQVKLRPRLAALLMGRSEAASIRLHGVRIEAGPGGEAIRALSARVRRPHRGDAGPRQAAASGPATDASADDAPAVRITGLVVAFPAGGVTVETEPVDLSLARHRSGRGERVTADLALPSGGRASLDLRRDPTGWHAGLRVSRLAASDLPRALRAGVASLEAGALSVEATADAAPDLGSAEGRLRVIADALYLGGERVSPEPVGPVSASLDGAVAWVGAERRVRLRGGRVGLPGGAALELEGEARVGPGVPFRVEVRADGLDLAALEAALPAALAPPPEAPRPPGTLDGHVALAGLLLAPAGWSVDAALDLSRMREAARRAPPVALRAPFVHRPDVEEGPAPAITVGPASPDFVPVAELPVHVVRAVTASEDAGFFAHEGFDFEELRNAIAQGAEAGHVVRGGSTITQQLAKNLYLSREKTLARKVREALITAGLEATVPKQRLLEIYLNVAEWGPGVWGLGPAARHWFGKDARVLTPREAAFLATVIPNPVRYHVLWVRGALTEAWDQRVNELLLKMEGQGAITEEQLVEAMAQPLVFARPAAVAVP